jgi:hypothetical protein
MGMGVHSPIKANFVQRERCISCDSCDLTVLDTGNFREGLVHQIIVESPHGEDPLPALSEAEWVLQKCQQCMQVFHRHVLDPEWMTVAYSRWASAEAMAEFERRMGADTFVAEYQAALQRFRHVLRLEKLTRDFRGDGPVRLVDFGCGRGEFVDVCLNNGFEAYGVDFSEARIGSAEVKIFASLDDVPGQFHVATLFEVLEHVEQPAAILAMLSDRMLDGGILVVETPDCTGVTGIHSQRDHHLVDPIQHINGYTPQTLTAIVERSGFRRIRRPMVSAAAGPVGIAKNVASYIFGRSERSTQQYFRKI